MKSKAERQLERRAIDCHRDGIGWNDFWGQHGTAVAQAAPYHHGRFHRMVAKLLHFVASGEGIVEPTK